MISVAIARGKLGKADAGDAKALGLCGLGDAALLWRLTGCGDQEGARP